MSVQPGQSLLHFEIVDKIGEGGMGAVWRATDTTLGRDVAIKLVPRAFADDADRLARFEREARALAALNHPNVAAIYGLHETATDEGSIKFLSMELVEGEDLQQRLVKPAWWGYHDPIWSEDGRRILYVSTEKGSWDLYVRNADGSGEEEPFLVTGYDKSPYDLDDGRLLYWASDTGNLSSETRLYDPKTDESTMIQEGAQLVGAQFSPDARFFIYDQVESGRLEVFVQSIDSGARWQVSTAGGDDAKWSDDGGEIVYADPEGRIMAVPVTISGAEVRLGRPEVLFRLDDGVMAWDATGDHRRFLVAERPTRGNDPIYVILDWDAAIVGEGE